MPAFDKIVRVFGPIRELVAGFAISGYIFYNIPISDEVRHNSKYYNPHANHDH
eukprot:m.477289 g.477289  ORF g.477289 m.477289 type:complete len:53 (+) comp20800_c0_seq1:3083-3241(+)